MIIRSLFLWILGTNLFVQQGFGKTTNDKDKEPVTRCDKIDKKDQIENGDVICSNHNHFGSICEVTCDGGHYLENQPSVVRMNVTCLTTGNWTGEVPKTCEETMLSKLRCFGFGLGLPIVFIMCLALIGIVIFGQRDCRDERKRRKALKKDAQNPELKEIIPLKS